MERAPERINQSESEEDIEMIEEQILKDAQKVSLNKRKFNKKVNYNMVTKNAKYYINTFCHC